MPTVLVTGGAGFIGSHYVKYLLEHYEEIQIINADILSYSANLGNLMEINDDPRHVFVKVDLADEEQMKKLFSRKIDQIVHFAAESHVDRSIESAEIFMQSNIIGTFRLLEKAKEHGISRFVHISTDEVYGSYPVGKASEDAVLEPGNPYSASKASSDLIALSYYNTFKLPIVITRCTNNYGPNQHPEKFIPNVIYKLVYNEPVPIYGNGMQERDWLFVTDHCSAIDLVRNKGNIGEVYHIGAEDPKCNLDVAKEIADILRKPHSLLEYVKDRPGHDVRYCLDTSKIKTSLHWKPKINFNEGITQTIEWYLKSFAI